MDAELEIMNEAVHECPYSKQYNKRKFTYMKRAVLVTLLVFIAFIQNAYDQEFSFQMTFIDAVGNSDTLIFGYDNEATDSVDAEFGELNIMDTELDSLFDVRVTNEWYVRAWPGYGNKSRFHLNKQIVRKNCDTWAEPISIDIKSNNWPVTAKWDSNLFIVGLCNVGSVFTSLNPGLWWDVMTPSNLYICIMSDHTEVTFTSNADKYFYPGDINQDSYINSDKDTISVFWVVIGTNHLQVDQHLYNNSILLYPNPAKDYIQLNPENNLPVSCIEVYDMTGRKQDVTVCGDEIDIRKLGKGLYCLRIVNGENRIIIGKFIKY